jgi:rhamnogalacturonyl hydrolase YesR
MIKAIKERLDSIMLQPLSGREDWWWCDALYMAPQVYAKLGTLTGEEKYFKYLHEQFFDAVDYLYDKEESLFYRDNRYFDKRTLHGKKVFWSRGNGWVFAGIPRVLDKLPANDPYRTKYIEIFRQMADRIINLQGDDGLWRASLLDAEEFPMKETSGTAMFSYGLAWGINNNILEKEKYLPALKKAWEGLLSAVNEEGRLRYVQPVGAAPGKYDENNTHCYAVGAFLKAGEQLIIMNQN